MMNTEIIAFGIAKEILEKKQIFCQTESGTIAEIRHKLVADYPAFQRLNSLKFAVGKNYVSEDYILKDGESVVIIPPVSGG